MKALLFKGLSIALVGSCLLATRAVALMVPDADGDGMSDVWEGQHGFSITSGSVPAHHGPTADPDQDGWTNLEESEAGTDPNAADAPSGMLQPTILRHPDFESVMVVSWPSLPGKQYTLLVSPDLSSGTWSAVDVPTMGTGGVIDVGMETLHPDGTRPEKLFWRVAVSDLDSDGDNVSDWNELQLGLNPNLGDSDGDTLADGAEIQAGLNPGHRDTDLDGIPDNLDSSPLENAALADRDGANLSASLNQGVIARWDFDASGANQTSLVSTPATGPQAAGPVDIANTSAGWDGADNWPSAATGMPWACLHFTRLGSHAKLPATRLATSTQSWAMWVRFTPGTLDSSTKRRTLFSITTQRPSSGTTEDEPHIHCYLAGDIPSPAPTSFGVQLATPPDDSIVIATHWPSGQNRPDELIQGSWPVPPSLDDGHWHHLVIGFGGGKYRAYFDGAVIATPANDSSLLSEQNGSPVPLNQLFGTGNYPLGVLGQVNTLYDPTIYEALNGSVDRLRVYNRFLGVSSIATVNTEAKQLYNQDIDRDGLFDRTEARSRFWRDHNQDKIDQQSETTFPIDPFRWDAEDSDHDRDGLTTHAEQNIHQTGPWNPDSDGDLMPDGWEVQYGLNPTSNTDAFSDSEPLAIGGADGLNNLAEYSWGTNPKARDTDQDGTPDGQEVGPPGSSPPSHPNDPRDGGQPIPSDQKLTIKIAVGDESGSHSEDYVVECRRIDPETGAELHVYTVRSGGFGQFSNPASGYSMFRKGDTHTFQLKWQGTKNTVSGSGSPSDGPDYDYTFRVEPQGDHGGILIDSWDKQNGSVDVGQPLQGTGLNNVATDEAEFRTKIEGRRVALVKLKVEWEEFAGFENLSDHVDPWTEETKGKRIFPCYKNPNDTTFRHKLKLVVRGGLMGIPVFVKSYDIDDSTSEVFDLDSITGLTVIDVNGKAGSDNRLDYLNTGQAGQFWNRISWGDSSADKEFDQFGVAEFDFRVGMQPGNNYRVIASLVDSTGFAGVQTTDEALAGYLGPYESHDGGKISSPALTVWRRLWIENDSMVAIPIDQFGYKRNDLSSAFTNPIINAVATAPDGTGSVFFISPISDGSSFLNLENGRIIVQSNSLAITGTGVTVDEDHLVSVAGDHTSVPLGSAFRLYDDDDTGVSNSLPNLDLVDPVLSAYFKSSFIMISDADLYNNEKFIPFKLHDDMGFSSEMASSRNVNEKEGIWVSLVVSGYQWSENEDHDPKMGESVTVGYTPPFQSGADLSGVFVEACRETWDQVFQNEMRYGSAGGDNARESLRKYIIAIAAHEIGHQPGGLLDPDQHNEGGLMRAGAVNDFASPENETFSAKTVLRFRTTSSWSK